MIKNAINAYDFVNLILSHLLNLTVGPKIFGVLGTSGTLEGCSFGVALIFDRWARKAWGRGGHSRNLNSFDRIKECSF